MDKLNCTQADEKLDKLGCMLKDEKLFREFQELVKRGRDFLDVFVLLGQKEIEVYRCAEDGKVFDLRSYEYASTDVKQIKALMDDIADERKQRWLPEFRKVSDSSPDIEDWALGLDPEDYAVLEIGARTKLRQYKIPWKREGLVSVLKYLTDASNPDLGDD